jgi:hypothetical protein
VLVVGEACGSRKNGVGAGSLEEGLIVLWRRWFSAPLEYATPAASSISAATISFCVRRLPGGRRLPLLLGLDRIGAPPSPPVGRVLP